RASKPSMTEFLTLLAQTTTTQAAAAPPAVHGASHDFRWFAINILYLTASVCFVFGLKMLAAPKTARRGNLLAAAGMVVAVVATLFERQIVGYWTIAVGLLVGAGVGATLALRVHMKGMPQMVSLFNGFGGLAAAMVGFGEYLHRIHLGAKD